MELLRLAATLAQASLPGADSFTAIATALAGSGFAVWYAWYMTTTQVPRIHEYYGGIIAKLTAEFRAEQTETRTTFRETLDTLCERLENRDG